jgi:hypothetical protein
MSGESLKEADCIARLSSVRVYANPSKEAGDSGRPQQSKWAESTAKTNAFSCMKVSYRISASS